MTDNYDNSVTTLVELFIVEQLAALTLGDSDVKIFRTCDIWNGQIGADRGGIEAFERFSPFCFVAYQPGFSMREGGNDLRQPLSFSVTVGVTAKTPAQCRIGKADGTPGTNKLEQLVIAALDSQHPTGTDTDDLRHRRTELIVDFPNKRAIQMDFDLNYII